MENNIYENAKIVVIDDVNEVLESVKNCLEFEGMQVTCFISPIEGLEYLKENKVDVLLLDFFMPEMNGDKFVQELRKYNQETIVILQTGYSDKIPPLEMIDKMNIQGYLDKLKGEDELLLMTKAAIKTSFLNKQIREKDKEIAKLNYKKAITGNLIEKLVNEAKDQLMQIGIMNGCISAETDKFKTENESIMLALEKTQKLYEALNFDFLKEESIEKLKEVLEILLKPTLLFSNAQLSFEIDNNNIIIKEASQSIYLIIKLVEILTNNEVKNIKLRVITENNTMFFEIETDKEIEKTKLQELELLCENREFIIGNRIIRFSI